MTGSDHPSVSFVALGAYPMLSGRADIRHIGEAGVQQACFARALQDRGYRTSFVAMDHGRPDSIVHSVGLRAVRGKYRRSGRLIVEHGLVEVAEGLDELRSALIRFFQNGDRWHTCAANARRYVALHHSVQEAVSAYEQVLLDLTQRAPR